MLVSMVYQDGSTAPLPDCAAHLNSGDVIAVGGLEHQIVWARLTVAGGELLELFTVPMPSNTMAPQDTAAASAAYGAAMVLDGAAMLSAAGFSFAEVTREGAGYVLMYQTVTERYELEADTVDKALAEAAEFLGGVSVDVIGYRDH